MILITDIQNFTFIKHNQNANEYKFSKVVIISKLWITLKKIQNKLNNPNTERNKCSYFYT